MNITAVRAYLLSSPYGNGAVLGQPLGLKTIGIVAVETDTGLRGVGESYAAVYAPELFAPIVEVMAARLVGRSATDPETVFEEMAIPFVGRNGLYLSVYSAVDTALWDLASQARGVPMHRLLSDDGQQRVKCYASGGSAFFGAEEMARDARAALDRGFDSYKMRVGFHDWSTDLERVRAARAALGNDARLMVDAIMGTAKPTWTADTAAERIKQLEDHDPYWIEEPLHPNDLQGLRQLHRNTRTRIATGEALVGEFEFREYLASDAVDVLQIDVTHCGGPTVARRVIREAAARGMPIAMHVWGSSLALAANSEAAFAFPNVEWLEIPTVTFALSTDLHDCAPVAEDGYVRRSAKTGLTTVHPGALAKRYPFVPGTGYVWGARAPSAPPQPVELPAATTRPQRTAVHSRPHVRMRRSIGVGIAGGGFGVRVLLPCLQAAGFDVRMVQSRNPARIESQVRAHSAARVTTDYRELLEDSGVAVVCVATEPALHGEMAIAALEAGKHLLCEKPLARTTEEARAIADAGRNGSVVRAVDHELRFHPNVMRIRRAIRDGEIGDLRYVVLRYSSSTRADARVAWDWWSDAVAGGGQLNAIGSHMVDTLCWWVGARAVDARGTLARFTHMRRADGRSRAVTSDEHAAFDVEFADGVTASVVVSAVDPTDAGLQAEIVGTAGRLVLDGFDSLTIRRGTQLPGDIAVPDTLLGSPVIGLNSWRTSLVRYGQHLLQCVRDAVPHAGATLDDGVRTQSVLDAIRRSAEVGRPNLPLSV